MMRWVLISMIAAQLMGCGASYEDRQRGICHAEHKEIVPVYDEFSKAGGPQCL